MGVDEAGDENGGTEIVEVGPGGGGNLGVGTDRGDAPVGADQDRGVLNGRSVNRKDPPGPEAKRPHHPPRKGLCRGQ